MAELTYLDSIDDRADYDDGYPDDEKCGCGGTGCVWCEYGYDDDPEVRDGD